MQLPAIFEYFKILENDSLSLLYNGYFKDDILTKILSLSKQNLSDDTPYKKMKNRVSYFLAECFQNILRHSAKDQMYGIGYSNQEYFLARNIHEKFYIASGNLMENKDIDELRNRLNTINKLSKEELKTLHTDILLNGKISEKGGAGLGLISMAKKSGEKIKYIFEPYNEEFSFFYNQFKIGLIKDSKYKDELQIENSVQLFKKLSKENILLIQKGNFAQEYILPLLNIIDKNFRENHNEYSKGKEVYHVLVELLQNISNHSFKIGERKEGILLIAKNKLGFIIGTGNFIDSKNVKIFKEYLSQLQEMDQEQLRNLYLESLKRDTPGEVGAGVGIIDVFRVVNAPVKFHFESIDNDKHFFSIFVRV